MSQNKTSLLFVCLGNICRSPAADGVVRKFALDANLDVEIDSAAIGSWHIGSLPDSRMRACGRRHGYDFSHRARQVSPLDFDSFDLIFGMDQQNLADLRRVAPSQKHQEKIRLMANFLTDHPAQNSIPDPYYGDDADFEFALELIEDAARNIVQRLANGKPL